VHRCSVLSLLPLLSLLSAAALGGDERRRADSDALHQPERVSHTHTYSGQQQLIECAHLQLTLAADSVAHCTPASLSLLSAPSFCLYVLVCCAI
jgi:hypothetical protein